MTEKKESTIRSADDLIVQSEAEKLGKVIPALENKSPQPSQTEEPTLEVGSEPIEAEQNDSLDNKTETETITPPPDNQEGDTNTAQDAPQENEVDEYGTKVGKKKLYTEEEVQRMIRDRLKRGNQPEQQQEVREAAKDFKPDPESDESWEIQLEGFVEKTIEKLSKKQADTQWRQQEEKNQADFEIKFSQGMGKYTDFSKVVAGKPITDTMMLATRSMNDPAAFLYAACKQQPKELARIAQIPDPLVQATEIGRLEEKMKKARQVPSAPKPATRINGDTSSDMPQLSIDARIAAHAKTKIMR